MVPLAEFSHLSIINRLCSSSSSALKRLIKIDLLLLGHNWWAGSSRNCWTQWTEGNCHRFICVEEENNLHISYNFGINFSYLRLTVPYDLGTSWTYRASWKRRIHRTAWTNGTSRNSWDHRRSWTRGIVSLRSKKCAKLIKRSQMRMFVKMQNIFLTDVWYIGNRGWAKFQCVNKNPKEYSLHTTIPKPAGPSRRTRTCRSSRPSRTSHGSCGWPIRRPPGLRLWATSSWVQRGRSSAQQQCLHHSACRPRCSSHPESPQEPDRQHEEPRRQQETSCQDLRRPQEVLPHEEKRWVRGDI